MTEKPRLEESTHPPLCPACRAPLRQLEWHKVQGGPMSISYLVLLSCAACRVMVGSVAV
jgi:hypothetical protein